MYICIDLSLRGKSILKKLKLRLKSNDNNGYVLVVVERNNNNNNNNK